jgi:glycosyltransferase involved in cell wall biosynthesis
MAIGAGGRWQNRRRAMRVLLLHNRYRSAGGEERAVADLAGLLERRGHAVHLIDRTSARGGRRGAGAEATERRRAARGLLAGGLDSDEVADAVRRWQPDVVHAHNLHPTLGWRALAAAKRAGARTILHLHNFRLFCAIGVAFRDGEPCFRCQGRNTWPGLRLRCRGSLPEAAVYAVGLHRQQPHIYEQTDRFLTVSRATADRLTELGLPGERLDVLPNFASRFADQSRAAEGRYALAVGRLTVEKGFDTAIAACRSSGVPLVVAGEGPDAARLRALAGDEVEFRGHVSEAELAELRAGAAMLLAPSRWEEPCPYAVIDALAGGVPVLASGRGGLPELVGDSVSDWSAAVSELWRDTDGRASCGEAGLIRARERLSEEAYYARLMEIYAG